MTSEEGGAKKGVKQLNDEMRSFTLLNVGWASGAGGGFRHVRVEQIDLSNKHRRKLSLYSNRIAGVDTLYYNM